jgi:hypothetical protein
LYRVPQMPEALRRSAHCHLVVQVNLCIDGGGFQVVPAAADDQQS